MTGTRLGAGLCGALKCARRDQMGTRKKVFCFLSHRVAVRRTVAS